MPRLPVDRQALLVQASGRIIIALIQSRIPQAVERVGGVLFSDVLSSEAEAVPRGRLN